MESSRNYKSWGDVGDNVGEMGELWGIIEGDNEGMRFLS